MSAFRVPGNVVDEMSIVIDHVEFQWSEFSRRCVQVVLLVSCIAGTGWNHRGCLRTYNRASWSHDHAEIYADKRLRHRAMCLVQTMVHRHRGNHLHKTFLLKHSADYTLYYSTKTANSESNS